MKIKVNVKQLGKKKPIVAGEIIEIGDLQYFTVEELLTNVVREQVQSFHIRAKNKAENKLLTNEEIERQTAVGKVVFGELYNTLEVDENQAVETALLAFTDGLFCIFHNGSELTSLTQIFDYKEDSEFTFVRLTFLSGRLY